MTLTSGFAWGSVIGRAARTTPPAADRRRWEQQGRLPALPGTGFETRFPEDLALLAEQGMGHVRLTVDWARLQPAAGQVDRDELERLGQVLDAAEAAGLGVWACLHEQVSPGWFLDEGGFADDRARVWWSRWVELVAQSVGDRLAGWFPLAEPVRWATDGYLLGTAPPGRRDPEAFAAALRGSHLAWRDAWRILRGGDPPVATCHRVGPIHAADATVPARRAARLADDVWWGSWVSGLRDGVLRVPGLADEEVADLAGSGDLVGVVHLGAAAVSATGTWAPYPPGERVAESGWAPWPEALGTTLRRLADELPGRPVLVAGSGVATTDDEWRADLLRATVAEVTAAVDDGVDVRGWFHLSTVDGDDGGPVPAGLADLDRNAKPSWAALADAIAATG